MKLWIHLNRTPPLKKISIFLFCQIFLLGEGLMNTNLQNLFYLFLTSSLVNLSSAKKSCNKPQYKQPPTYKSVEMFIRGTNKVIIFSFCYFRHVVISRHFLTNQGFHGAISSKRQIPKVSQLLNWTGIILNLSDFFFLLTANLDFVIRKTI